MASASGDDDEAVRDAFAQWVAMQNVAPRHAEALIEQLEVSHEYAGFLNTEIQGRRFVWNSVPAAARTRVTVAEMAPAEFDVWHVESDSLRRRSIHIAICDACVGEKQLRCTACRGSGKQTCGICNGQRKTYGYASNGAYRLLNCAGCRGRGDVDCAHCRRGVAVCGTCAGEGKLQRWLEIDSWQRSAFNAHPPAIAAQLNNDAITDDAEIALNVDREEALANDDLDAVPEQWLTLLRPDLTADEHVARQRLRIARVPKHSVHYRLGGETDSVTFTGRRLVPPVSSTASNAFERRAARLHALRLLLIAIAVIVTIASLARGAFFRSVFTFFSLAACNSALIVIYAFATDWTAARLYAPLRVATAAALLIVSILFAVAALPRAAHAEATLASGNVDDAEAELRLLRADAPESLWADLHFARIERAEDLAAARDQLVLIPHSASQYQKAASDVARIAINIARGKVAQSDWSGAADAIAVARKSGGDKLSLQALGDAIESAAVAAAAKAKDTNNPNVRLQRRLKAEEIFRSWQRATEASDPEQLIALRLAMARDVATLERRHKH